MFKAKNRLLPINLQEFFILSSVDRNDRRKFDFKSKTVSSIVKQMCISVNGEKL